MRQDGVLLNSYTTLTKKPEEHTMSCISSGLKQSKKYWVKLFCLSHNNKITATILCPGEFIMAEQERLFLTVGNSFKPVLTNTKVNKIFFYALCSSLAKGHVVFIGPSFVTIAFNAKTNVGAFC